MLLKDKGPSTHLFSCVSLGSMAVPQQAPCSAVLRGSVASSCLWGRVMVSPCNFLSQNPP